MNKKNLIIILIVTLPMLIFTFGLIGYGSLPNEVTIEASLLTAGNTVYT